MSSILSHVAASRRRFVPQSVDDFVGLQICRALKDEEKAYDYLLLARRHNARMLLSAFHSMREAFATGWPVLDSFRAGLGATTGSEVLIPSTTLIAISIERHAIGLAVFRGLRPEHIQIRHLHTNLPKAKLAAAAFTRWALTQFGNCAAVIEIERDAATAHVQLHRSVIAAVREFAAPLWQCSAEELLSAYAHPACSTRGELRKIVGGVWPNIALSVSDRALLDALGVGLLAQVKRQIDGESAVEKPA